MGSNFTILLHRHLRYSYNIIMVCIHYAGMFAVYFPTKFHMCPCCESSQSKEVNDHFLHTQCMLGTM